MSSRPDHSLLQRLHPLAAAALGRRRSRQGPAGDRAGDARAGRHRPLAAQLPLPQRRPGAGGLRRLEDPALGLRDRDRPGGARATRSSSRSSSTAASTRSACSPRSATPRYAAAAPQPRPAARRRHRPSPRTRACSGTPRPAALATLHGEGKVSAFPAIGYDHPDQSHFTSRHYYEIGELAGRLPDRLAGPLPRRGRRRRKPAAGPLARRLALADDRDRGKAGGGDRQRRRLRPLVAGRATRSKTRCSAASPASARCPPTRPAWPRCAAPPPRPTSCARNSPASATSPARSPTPTTWFAHKLAGLAAYIAVGLPMRVVTIRAPGGYDTHADQADRPRRQPAARPARGSSPSSATSRRAASPTGS